MNASKMAALVLIVAGVLALAYGGFTYNSTTEKAQIGPIALAVTEQHRVNVPMWAGIGAIVVGGLLLVVGSKRG